MAEMTALEQIASKFVTEPKNRKGEPTWKITGRHILLHLFINVLGEKVKIPRGKDLPSLDADAMEKFKGPVARTLGKMISDYRSEERTISSTKGALEFIAPHDDFSQAQGPYERAEFCYRTMGFDAVERVFAKAAGSIPLNIDKGARKAFITGPRTLSLAQLIESPLNLLYLSLDDWKEVFTTHPVLLYTFDESVIDQPPEKLMEFFAEMIWPHRQSLLSWLKTLPTLSQAYHYDKDAIAKALNTPLFPEQIWVSFDWSQAEVHMLCTYSQDPVLKAALEADDFHSAVAMMAFNLADVRLVTPELRELAKLLTFAFIYSSFDVNVAKAIIQNKKPDVDLNLLETALHNYIDAFRVTFDWVKEAQLAWGGTQIVEYAYFSRKKVERPEYVKQENLGQHESGRVAVNTYGQNSIGILLKKVITSLATDPLGIFQEKTDSMIPLFDALYFKADLQSLHDVMLVLESYIAPKLTLHPKNYWYREGAFSITLKYEVKTSLKSWGEVGKTAQIMATTGEVATRSLLETISYPAII